MDLAALLVISMVGIGWLFCYQSKNLNTLNYNFISLFKKSITLPAKKKYFQSNNQKVITHLTSTESSLAFVIIKMTSLTIVWHFVKNLVKRKEASELIGRGNIWFHKWEVISDCLRFVYRLPAYKNKSQAYIIHIYTHRAMVVIPSQWTYAFFIELIPWWRF